MTKKKNHKGHYCWGCETYKSNESFSGKGHANHLCKKCKVSGVRKAPKEGHSKPKKKSNAFIKSIKIKCIIIIDRDTFILFGRGGALYLACENYRMKGYHIYEYCKREEFPMVATNLFDNEDATFTIDNKTSQLLAEGLHQQVESYSEVENIEKFEKKFETKLTQWFGTKVDQQDWNDKVLEFDEADIEDLYLTDFRVLYLQSRDREKHILRSLPRVKEDLEQKIKEIDLNWSSQEEMLQTQTELLK